MSTHNICFRGKIRKILCGYPLLSVAMNTGPDHTGAYSEWVCLLSIVFMVNTKVLI